jgi:hypothetical protein
MLVAPSCRQKVEHTPGAARLHKKAPPERGFTQAAEGTRTLDLLHGKQTL